jgi:hypothetical protein
VGSRSDFHEVMKAEKISIVVSRKDTQWRSLCFRKSVLQRKVRVVKTNSQRPESTEAIGEWRDTWRVETCSGKKSLRSNWSVKA